jgi:hypothetical protein
LLVEKSVLRLLNQLDIPNRTGVPEINTFDLMSRLTMTEFNKFVYLENSQYLFPRIKNGILRNITVSSPSKNKGITFTKKTKIKSRKAGTGSGDVYFPIKAASTGQYVIPPGLTDWGGTFGGFTKAEGVAKPNATEAKRGREK